MQPPVIDIMNSVLKKLILSIVAFFALGSCSTDFDVLAPYKEIPVVYGLLNRSDSLHIVKVNKGFVNLGADANQIASQIPDSINYPESVRVELINQKTGGAVAMSRSTSIQKDTGLFAYPDQVTYTSTLTLDSSAKYTIRVTNPANGVTAEATTPIVGNFAVEPNCFQCEIALVQVNPTNGDTLLRRKVFPVTSAPNARYYSVDIRYVIDEFFSDRPQSTRIINGVINAGISTGANSNIEVVLNPSVFFNTLVSNIDITKDPTTLTGRTVREVEITAWAATSEFEQYIRVSNNFSAISQTKPIYTNVSNGLGLFASRRRASRAYTLSTNTRAYLIRVYNRPVGGYKFF
jgi:hypothetical protein